MKVHSCKINSDMVDNLKNHSMNYYYLIVSPLLYEIILYCLIRLLYELVFFRLNVSSLLYDY